MGYYVYSTLTSDNVYAAFGPAVDGVYQHRDGILIRGGYGVATKTLVTPRGAVTQITEEQHGRLVEDPLFKLHWDNGFLTIEKASAPAEAVAANMNQDDPSRPLEEGDLMLDPDSPMAETGPRKPGRPRKAA
jgi:hypothetical protein